MTRHWPAVLATALLLAGCASSSESGNDKRVALFVHTFEKTTPRSPFDHLVLEERASARIAEQAANVSDLRLVAPLPPKEVEALRQTWELHCEAKGRALDVSPGRPDVEMGGTVAIRGNHLELRGWFQHGERRGEHVVRGELQKGADAEPMLRELAFSLLSAWRPDDATLLLKLGITLARNGLPSRAIKVYHKVLTFDPGNAAAHFNIGLAYDRVGESDAAIRAYEKALEIRPDYHHALLEMAVDLQLPRKKGESEADLIRRFDRAEAAYRKVLELAPRQKQAHMSLLRFLRMRGKLHEALEECRKIMRLFPADAYPPRIAGLVSLDLKRNTKALSFFQKAARLEPLLVSNDFFLAVALEALGRNSEAGTHYGRFVELAGTDRKFHELVAKALDRIEAIKKKLKEEKLK